MQRPEAKARQLFPGEDSGPKGENPYNRLLTK